MTTLHTVWWACPTWPNTVISWLNDRTGVHLEKYLENHVKRWGAIYQYTPMSVCSWNWKLLTLLSRSKRYESSSRWSASQSEIISPIYLKAKYELTFTIIKLQVHIWKYWKYAHFQMLHLAFKAQTANEKSQPQLKSQTPSDGLAGLWIQQFKNWNCIMSIYGFQSSGMWNCENLKTFTKQLRLHFILIF